ncbi:MAG: hypothetical protein HZA16_02630, partial [Nitrospirae bacterium]|nr:hypothetical protein [Nitrospirota bacterium]
MSKKKIFNWILVLLMALPLLTLSCGGGGGGGDGGAGNVPPPGDGGNPPGPAAIPPKPGVTIGVMKKGSVIVNGIRMTVSPTATITIDDVPGKTEADLLDGMVV